MGAQASAQADAQASAPGQVRPLSAPQAPDAAHAEAVGHRKMLALLKKVAKRTARKNIYLGDAVAERLRAALEDLPERASVLQRWRMLRSLGAHELRLGNTTDAIECFEAAQELVPVVGPRLGSDETTKNLFDLAVAYLRWGETRNCVAMHTSDSCLFPIRAAGVHTDKEGSQRAIALFRKVLKEDPESVGARWLLNLAYMTIGGYPDDVPARFRIPPERLQSDVEFPRFTDVAPERGLNSMSMCGSVLIEDFEGDGVLDVVTSDWDPEVSLEYFRGRGGGRYEERGAAAGFTGINGGLNLVQADYDDDGRVDVLVLRGAWLLDGGKHPNSLLRNRGVSDGEGGGDGGARFVDVTLGAGLGDVHYPTQTAAWADMDLDGDLDLYVGNESSAELEAPCQLFENRGDGTFEDVAAAAGVTNARYAKSASWGDVNGDRYPDLYVSNRFEANRLYLNRGDGTFEDVAVRSGVTSPRQSFPAWFWDVDNDGALDLYVSSYWAELEPIIASYLGEPSPAELPRLYLGDGRGNFENAAPRFGLTRADLPMGSNFGDLDHDGYLDFYLGTGFPGYEGLMPNVMYWNRGGQRFADVTIPGGFGHLQKGHGVAFADLDGDADQDVFIEMGGAFPGDGFGNALFENPGFGNHWLELELVGVTSNRSAIGSRIRAVIEEDGVERSVYRHVNTGGTFGGNPLRQSLGLGKAAVVKRLEVTWPASDTTQVFEDVAAGRRLRVVEGAHELEELPRR